MRKLFNLLLLIFFTTLIYCSNPVRNETEHITGILGEPAGLATVEFGNILVKFWEIEIPSFHIIEVIIETNYGEWIPADWSLNNTMNTMYIYKTNNINNESKYYIEYRI